MHSRHKIVIVGAGPAGLGAALHLVRRSPALADDLIILEGKQHPRPKLCGGAITFHGEQQLRTLGLEVDVTAFAARRIVFRLGGQTFSTDSDAAMRVFERREFDAALARAAAARGLRIQSDARLLDLTMTDGGVRLTTTRGDYHAQIVIGADGATSTVRRKLRLPSAAGVARLLRVMTPIDPATTPAWGDRSVLFDFTPVRQGIQGYMWDFPCYVDGVPHMNRGIFDSRLFPHNDDPRAGLKEVFAAGLHSRAVDLDAITLEGHPVRWFNPLAEFARPHVLLAGDAAGVDPLFAEGISYALEYGDVVAGVVLDALARRDFSFADYRARLLAHPLGRSLQRRAWVARAIYSQRVPPFWPLLWGMAGVAPARVKRAVGAALDVLA